MYVYMYLLMYLFIYEIQYTSIFCIDIIFFILSVSEMNWQICK